MKLRLACLSLVLGACGLNPAVLYRCADEAPRCQAGASCWADGYCHPLGEDDGGVTNPLDSGDGDGGAGSGGGAGGGGGGADDAGDGRDGGGCLPATLAACAGVECGFVDAGCGLELDCGAWCAPGLECGVTSANACGTPSVCAPTGWCWENPLPLGMSYLGIAAPSPRAVWLAGEDGVAFFDGEKTRLEDLGLSAPASFDAVAASSAREAFLVGAGGLLFHFDGSAWRKEGSSNALTSELRAVLALGPGMAIAAGDNGKVLFRFPDAGGVADAQRWIPADSTGTSADVLSLAATDGGVYALTRSGQLLQRTGLKTFAVLSTLALNGDSARALGSRGATLYAAVGDHLTRFDGSGWTSLDAGQGYRYTAFALDGPDLWVAGTGVLQRLDQREVFGPNLADAGLSFNALAALRAGEVLAGGANGTLAVSAAGGLLLRSAGTTRPITTLCGSSPNSFFAGGLSDACAPNQCRPHVWARSQTGSGAAWQAASADALGNTSVLTGCYALDDAHTVLLGDDTLFYRWNVSGSRFVANSFGNGQLAGTYLGGWGTPDAGFFFAREGKTALAFGDPTLSTFSRLDVGSGNAMTSVWGVTSADWLCAVGEKGTIAERDHNHAWQARQFGGTQATMRAVHASRASDGGYFFVAAGDGVAWTRAADGGTFEDVLPGAPLLRSAWSSSTQTLWVGGNDPAGRAAVARRNPGSGGWQPVPLVTGRGLSVLSGIDLDGVSQSVWIAGDGGMILRLDTR